MRKVCMAVVLIGAVGLFGGCTGDVTNPPFGMPDIFAVTTLEAIQGTTGNLLEFSNTEDPNALEIVFEIRDADVSPAPVYILIRSGADTPQDALISDSIRMLNQARQVRLERSVPDGYARLASHTITMRMEAIERPRLSAHTRHLLFQTQAGSSVYITLCVSFDQAAYRKFWDFIATGPKVIGGGPPTTGDGPSPEFTGWFNSDPVGGPIPPAITEVRYIHDGTTGGSPTEPDINKVRKKQEMLLISAYGSNYQDDPMLHRAVRVMDGISEGYRQTGLLFLTHRDFDILLADRNKVLFEATGIQYFTTTFIWHSLVLGFYANPPGTSHGIILEYIRLNLTYPGSSERQLLKYFEQSVSDGLVLLENPWIAR